MTYTVVWKRSAEAELADLWLNAPDQNAVALAANTADALFRQDPLSQGESRADGNRILFIAPLVLSFHVSPADRLVTVTAIGRWEPAS